MSYTSVFTGIKVDEYLSKGNNSLQQTGGTMTGNLITGSSSNRGIIFQMNNPDCLETQLRTSGGNGSLGVSFVSYDNEGSKIFNTLIGIDGKRTWLEKGDLLNIVYPIGSVYTSYNNTSPAKTIGGTWEQIYSDYDYIYIGGQIIYDNYTKEGTDTGVTVIGSYGIELLENLNTVIPCPTGYTYKVSLSAQYSTSNSNQIDLYFNDIQMAHGSNTWSQDSFRRITASKRIIAPSEIPQKPTVNYSSNGINLIIKNTYTSGNGATQTLRVWDITLHGWYVSNNIIYKWKRTA